MIGLDIHYACKVDDAMLRILSIFFRCQNGSARMSSLRAPFRMRPIELSAAPTRRNKMAKRRLSREVITFIEMAKLFTVLAA